MTTWPTILKEVINWFNFLNIMEYTADKIENEITLLPSFLNFFAMFQMNFWYDNEHNDQNNVENIAIRCNNCGKETGLYMKNMNTNYNDIINSFVQSTVLHHFGMSWVIETYEQLKYYMEKHDPGLITGGTQYNTYICKKIPGTVFEE